MYTEKICHNHKRENRKRKKNFMKCLLYEKIDFPVISQCIQWYVKCIFTACRFHVSYTFTSIAYKRTIDGYIVYVFVYQIPVYIWHYALPWELKLHAKITNKINEFRYSWNYTFRWMKNETMQEENGILHFLHTFMRSRTYQKISYNKNDFKGCAVSWSHFCKNIAFLLLHIYYIVYLFYIRKNTTMITFKYLI